MAHTAMYPLLTPGTNLINLLFVPGISKRYKYITPFFKYTPIENAFF
jgi:hypothetical protein